MTLTLIDWLIILVYAAITLTIAILFARRAGKNLTEYFVSGRNLPWWIAGTSMVATGFAADTPLAVTGIVIKYGLAGNWIWWAFAAGGMITVFVYAKLWRRAEVLTDVELIELRYAGKPAAALRGIRAVYVALLVNAIIIGWVCGAMITFFDVTLFGSGSAGLTLTGTATATDATDPDLESFRGYGRWLLLIGSLVFVGVYSTISGMWGVALTDAFQFVLAMIGCILLAFVAVQHVGGVGDVQTRVAEQFGGTQAFDFVPRFTGDNPWMPLHAFLIMALVQWWATWYPGSEPGGGGYVVQRMAACRDERHSLLATLWYQVAYYCLRPWPWIMVGFAALVLFPMLRESYLADRAFDPGVGYPMVIRELAPAGLRGLMLVTFFAAFMSTISTQMNWGASYLVRDVYQRFLVKHASDKHYARASRLASVLVLAAGGVATWIMHGTAIDEIWNILLALGAGTGAVFMLRWFWWRINAWSEIVAMLSSLLLFVLIGVGDRNLGTELLIVGTSQVKILLVAVGSIGCWLLATWLTGPEPMEKLVAFYRKTRPGGWGWGPVHDRTPETVIDDRPGWGLVTAFFASGVIYSVLPLVGFLIFGRYAAAIGCSLVTATCTLAVLVLMNQTTSKS